MSKAGLWTIAGVAAGVIALSGVAEAQTPKRGGTVTVGYDGGEPGAFDCTTTSSLSTMMYLVPHYSALIRPDIANYPKLEGDVADSWTVSPDGLTYTFKIRPNIKFHDGSILTSEDVKTSFERVRNPPQGVASVRKNDFTDVASIETPDAQTITFKMSRPNAGMMTNFAHPFNCIYSAKKLASDTTYPAQTVMGTGPFVKDEFVKGAYWTGKRFDGYFRAGQPYLNDFRIVQLSPNAIPNAYAGGNIDMMTSVVLPPAIEAMRQTPRGAAAAIKTTPLLVQTLVFFNTQRKPFDDARVRRALTLAIDRVGGIEPLKKVINVLEPGPILRLGSEFALPRDEVAKLPGQGPDITAARAEARRLLAEAGQSNLSVKLLNRDNGPFPPLGLLVIDQWRQIGVQAEQRPLSGTPFLAAANGNDYDAMVFQNTTTAEDPSEMLRLFVPGNPLNYGRYTDATLTELYGKQQIELDPTARKKLVNQFETRVMNEAYYAPLFWASWITVIAPDIHGWQQSPLYYSGRDMATLWRD